MKKYKEYDNEPKVIGALTELYMITKEYFYIKHIILTKIEDNENNQILELSKQYIDISTKLASHAVNFYGSFAHDQEYDELQHERRKIIFEINKILEDNNANTD